MRNHHTRKDESIKILFIERSMVGDEDLWLLFKHEEKKGSTLFSSLIQILHLQINNLI